MGVSIIVKVHNKIKFINDCDAIVDYNELEEAVMLKGECKK